MTTGLLVGAPAGFIVGVVVGIMLREALNIARTGHTGLMAIPRPTARVWGIVLVCIALTANFASGFISIANGRDDQDRARCIARYNELDGVARDARSAVAAGGTESELRLWENLRRQVRSGSLSAESFDDAITAHIQSLRATQRVRVTDPYPPADLCSPDYDPSGDTVGK